MGNEILRPVLRPRTSIVAAWLGRMPGAELPPLKRTHRAPHDTSLPLEGPTGFAAASLTVIALSVQADVSRADMVLACLVTRVGMSFLSRLSQSAPGWVLGEELIKIGIGEFVHLDSPWLRWSCRCGEVKVGSTPKPPYMAITLASADAEAAPGSWITVQTVILVWIKVQTAISTLIEIKAMIGRMRRPPSKLVERLVGVSEEVLRPDPALRL